MESGPGGLLPLSAACSARGGSANNDIERGPPTSHPHCDAGFESATVSVYAGVVSEFIDQGGVFGGL